jgi:streptogramin lyase
MAMAWITVVALAILSAGQQAKAQADRVFWSGYYSGIWSANPDGTDARHVFNTDFHAPYEGWHPRGLYCDLTASKLYFTDWHDSLGRRLQRMNFDGSGVEDVFVWGTTQTANDVALDGAGRIYWTDSQNGRIRSALMNGTGLQDVYVNGASGLVGLALDPAAGKMYWAEYDTGRICRAGLDGSSFEVLANGLQAPRYLDLDLAHSKVYWTEFGSGAIRRANLDGSSVELLLTSSTEVGGIALDASKGVMYWHDVGGMMKATLSGTGAGRVSYAGSEAYPADVVITPEPATLSLLALGGAVAVARRRRAARR